MAGDEYTDVNKYAHEGGDTAPGTREQIAERNKAADALAEAVRGVREDREKAQDDASAKIGAAEEAYAEAVPNPGVVGPADTSKGKKK